MEISGRTDDCSSMVELMTDLCDMHMVPYDKNENKQNTTIYDNRNESHKYIFQPKNPGTEECVYSC